MDEYPPKVSSLDMPVGKPKTDDFSKWQLETGQLIESVYYRLRGFQYQECNDGLYRWLTDEKVSPTLSEEGAREVANALYTVVDRNIFLSNLNEVAINRLTRKIVGGIIIRLGTDTARYGIEEDGVSDTTKLRKVKDMIECVIYAALCRSNSWETLHSLNDAHIVNELRGDSAQRRQGGFLGLGFPGQKQGG